MRRLLRWAFNLSAAASTVLFVGVCVLWVRSCFVSDKLECDWARANDARTALVSHRSFLQSNMGLLELDDDSRLRFPSFRPGERPPPTGPPPDAELKWTTEAPTDQVGSAGSWWQRAGFFHFYEYVPSTTGGYVWQGWSLPAWLPTLSLSLPTFIRVCFAVRRRRKRRPGLCARCGYDLRATPEAGGPLLACCPECGAVPKAGGAQ